MNIRVGFMVLALFALVGCASTEPKIEYVDRIVDAQCNLYHPEIPDSPMPPAVNIKVLTEDTIKPGQAYVGLEYDEWLVFAAWLHKYKAHEKSLISVIEAYREQ